MEFPGRGGGGGGGKGVQNNKPSMGDNKDTYMYLSSTGKGLFIGRLVRSQCTCKLNHGTCTYVCTTTYLHWPSNSSKYCVDITGIKI